MHWTIISVIVVGAVAAASGILTAYLQHRHERRGLMCAFAGEVGAIVAIVRRRKYLGLIDDHLAATRRGEKAARASSGRNILRGSARRNRNGPGPARGAHFTAGGVVCVILDANHVAAMG